MQVRISDLQKRIRVGTHGEDYGSWMSNPVFYIYGAQITGLDYWGAMYNYSKVVCEKNAASEGVGDRCTFVHGDANHLPFPDESFDAVISNYVYHNIVGADRQALLLESLRVLKKGGVFVLHDEMKPQMYGDMNAFAEKLPIQPDKAASTAGKGLQGNGKCPPS